MKKSFDIRDTNAIKGVAVVLLLWHHLFYSDNFIESFELHNIAEIISYYSKVCVAIFIILSGYGLNESWRTKKYSISKFYKKNFKKLYFNYWLIWILFVPIGVIFFNRTFSVVYNDNISLKFILNILGLQRIFDFYGYNPTWWFISLIFGLYLVFPILQKIVMEYPKSSLLVSFLIMFVPNYKIGCFAPFGVYGLWIFPFVIGIHFSNKNLFARISNYKIGNKYVKLFIYFGLLIIVMLYRRYGLILINTSIDGIFGLIIIQICYEYILNVKILNSVLYFIGTHSFNIFLFHTFIYYYYFTDFIYSFKNPILIFLVFIGVCLIISIMIEKIKQIIIRSLKSKTLNYNKIKVYSLFRVVLFNRFQVTQYF